MWGVGVICSNSYGNNNTRGTNRRCGTDILFSRQSIGIELISYRNRYYLVYNTSRNNSCKWIISRWNNLLCFSNNGNM